MFLRGAREGPRSVGCGEGKAAPRRSHEGYRPDPAISEPARRAGKEGGPLAVRHVAVVGAGITTTSELFLSLGVDTAQLSSPVHGPNGVSYSAVCPRRRTAFAAGGRLIRAGHDSGDSGYAEGRAACLRECAFLFFRRICARGNERARPASVFRCALDKNETLEQVNGFGSWSEHVRAVECLRSVRAPSNAPKQKRRCTQSRHRRQWER